VLLRAYTAQLHDAKTYDATERNQLLNFILEEKSNTMQACPPKHPAYTKFNNLMRGAMASMSVMRAVNEGAQVFERMLDALDNAECTTRLNLYFRKKEEDIHHLAGGDLLNLVKHIDDHIISQLFHKVPDNLEEITCCFPLQQLPPTFGMNGKLRHLQSIDLRGSEELTHLPERICSLRKLRTLSLVDCRSLTALPERLYELTALENLMMARCHNVQQLPQALGKLHKLRMIDLDECLQLRTLPDIVSTKVLFAQLEFLNLARCESLRSIPKWVDECERRGGAVQRPHLFHEEDVED